MKNKFRSLLNTVTNSLKAFGVFLKSNMLFCAGLLVLEAISLFSLSAVTLPFDNYCVTEITERITKNANNSAFGYSVNSVQMKARGSSDYYLYNDNELQTFQTRNQKFEGIRDYIFAAYVPYGGYVPFSTKNYDESSSSQCSVISLESKFDGDSFYFDLPLLSGEIKRTIEKTEIVLLDTVAEKLTINRDFDSLIGKTITGKSITAGGLNEQQFKIVAVLDSNNNLGKTILSCFGSNIVFMSEYSSFQMEGYCYYFASTNKDENKTLVNFVYSKYKSTYNASRYLEVGYSAKHSFYEFDINQSLYLGECNESLNNAIDFYSGIVPTIFSIIGVVFVILTVFMVGMLFVWNRNKLSSHSKGVLIFASFVIVSFSLLISSLLYKYLPIVTIIGHQKMITQSPVTSSVVFLGWLALTLFVTVLSLKNNKQR